MATILSFSHRYGAGAGLVLAAAGRAGPGHLPAVRPHQHPEPRPLPRQVAALRQRGHPRMRGHGRLCL